MLAGLLGGAVFVRADPPSDKVKRFLGDKTAEIVEKATRVEVFRINSQRTNEPGDKYIAGYKITAKGKKQGMKFAAKVRAALFDEKTYLGQSARCYEPGVAFRVWHGEEAVEVIICFRCTNFEVLRKGAPLTAERNLFGFGPGLQPFLALAQEALPNDRVIQSLKSR
jgi:hypothetical protein